LTVVGPRRKVSLVKPIARAQVLEFVGRDWERVADAKIAHRAKLFRSRGPMATARIGWALYEHARHVLPGYPTPESRAIDHEHHRDLADKLERVAHRFRDA
jgi:hypothetical protein